MCNNPHGKKELHYKVKTYITQKKRGPFPRTRGKESTSQGAPEKGGGGVVGPLKKAEKPGWTCGSVSKQKSGKGRNHKQLLLKKELSTFGEGKGHTMLNDLC